MDYIKHYNILIDRAKTRTLTGYTERHHIIPKCMGGNNSVTNIVRLTAREHYVAHQLLIKMYPDNTKLLYAGSQMTRSNKLQNRVNNKLYAWIRERLAKATSIMHKGNTYRKEKKHSRKAKKKMRESAKTRPNINYSRPCSNKTKQKLKKINTGKKHTEETKKKISKAGFKRPLPSKETGEKISKAKKGKCPNKYKGIPRSEETKAKIRASKLGKVKMSKKSRKQISKTKKSQKRPAWNKGIKGYKNNPCTKEAKTKISISNTGRRKLSPTRMKNMLLKYNMGIDIAILSKKYKVHIDSIKKYVKEGNKNANT